MADIETIAIAPLFGPPSPARDQTDSRIMAAASGIGFMAIRNFPGDDWLTRQNRARLLAIFSLPEAEKQKLLRWNFDRTKENVYRGWFPLQPGAVSYKEGIDMGPDIADARTQPSSLDARDPLCEATPLPPESALPGWREAAAGYYKAMEKVGSALLRSVARGLGLTETVFDKDFEGGISTLRLIRYPLRDPNCGVDLSGPDFSVMHKGEMRTIIGREHADSGFVTLLGRCRGPAGKKPCRRMDRCAARRQHTRRQFRTVAGALDRRPGARDPASGDRAQTGALLDPVLL